MIYILIALGIATVAAAFLLSYSSNQYDGTAAAIAGVIGVFLGIACGIAAIAYAILAWSWFAADYKAKIINREYNTNYTQEEIFYASDVIETIRQLDRKRIELNGDLLKKESK